MSTTFVYNTGKSEQANDEINLSIGLFFDGTKNNRTNTEIRKKVQGVDEYADQSKEENQPSEDDIEIYNTVANPRTWSKLWLGRKEKNNSFKNDFSNVARMSLCTERKKYTVYIDGIGTTSEEGDTNEGLALGSGDTGVRGKVRNGCKELAKRIKRNLETFSNDNSTVNQIIIDVFGFSRGSAAARNFVYEINSLRSQDKRVSKKKVIVGYETASYGSGIQTPIYEDILVDRDGVEVNEDYLIDNKMPRHGYLGYYLLKEDVISPEELDDLQITVRFMGIYDTVASYNEVNNNKLKMAAKLGGKLFKGGFDGGVESLQLNNLGSFTKAVHFVAMDEHRLNFALTRLSGASNKQAARAVEKHFPGAHSDIGGSYDNMLGDDKEKVTLAKDLTSPKLKKLKKELKSQHWFEEEQLFKSGPPLLLSTLIGKREIRKEYRDRKSVV